MHLQKSDSNSSLRRAAAKIATAKRASAKPGCALARAATPWQARVRIGIAIFLLVFFVAIPAQAACLSYTARVRVEGTLERKTFAGPPNYESVAAGDAPERVWLLKLDVPACVAADRTDRSGINAAVRAVKEIQLLLTDVQYRTYAKWMGHRAVLTGKLFGAVTGHHHTPVLLDMVQFNR